MDHAEMLFAAEVRKLATELREVQRNEDMRPYAQAEEADRRDVLEAWGSEFPLSSFIPRAFREIAEVAKQVEALGAGMVEQGFIDLNR